MKAQRDDDGVGAGDYLEHLSDADVAFLARAASLHESSPTDLRAHPGLIERLLGDDAVFTQLFGERQAGPLVGASPFLVFAVLIHRCLRDLASAPFTMEWVAPRRRVPVFDAGGLRGFLESRGRRLFLAELLASYTHTASGSLYVRRGRSLRRHRFSELDPVRMAGLLEVVPERERPGIYRRLGDLALFLTGVFPDHGARFLASPLNADRLRRSGAMRADEAQRAPGGHGGDHPQAETLDMLSLLETLGERWYRLACETASPRGTQRMRLVMSVAERFGQARRVLNFIADRYLFPSRLYRFPGFSDH